MSIENLQKLNEAFGAFKIDPKVKVPVLGTQVTAPPAVQRQIEEGVETAAQDLIREVLLQVLNNTDNIYSRAELRSTLLDLISNFGDS